MYQTIRRLGFSISLLSFHSTKIQDSFLLHSSFGEVRDNKVESWWLDSKTLRDDFKLAMPRRDIYTWPIQEACIKLVLYLLSIEGLI